MKICTWNVNGIRARWQEVQRLGVEHAPDILCLQEIKATADQIPEPLTLLPDYVNLWHGAPKGYSGVSLHVRKGGACAPAEGNPQFVHPQFDFEARIVEAQVKGLTIASVYVPNGGKDYDAKLRFLESLVAHARAQAPDRPYVICGDLNVAHTDRDVHERHRKLEMIGQRSDERARLSGLLELGLDDVVRQLAPDADDLFTWWPPWRQEKQKNRGWRIDYLLASRALAQRAHAFEVLKNFGTSDHAPLLVSFG